MTTATWNGPDADTIYLGDNGRAYCGEHLGSSATHTGRDISGQPIMAVTPEAAWYSQEKLYHLPACEQCGKEAQT